VTVSIRAIISLSLAAICTKVRVCLRVSPSSSVRQYMDDCLQRLALSSRKVCKPRAMIVLRPVQMMQGRTRALVHV